MKNFNILVYVLLLNNFYQTNCKKFPGHEAKPNSVPYHSPTKTVRLGQNQENPKGIQNKIINLLNKTEYLKNKAKEEKKSIEGLINANYSVKYSKKYTMNKIPTIGIVANPDQITNEKKPELVARIASNYVYWITSGGARVIPILPWNTDIVNDELLNQVNGVIFPDELETDFFMEHSNTKFEDFLLNLYNKIKLKNMKTYLPLLAIGNGFNLIHNFTLNNKAEEIYKETLEVQDVMINSEIPVNFRSNKIKLFTYFDGRDFDSFKSLNSTFQTNSISIPLRAYLAYDKLREEFKISSYFRDLDKVPYVKSVEHKKFPIYGLQFRPEKFPWETTNKALNFMNEAITISQKILNLFISESRKNLNNFNIKNSKAAIDDSIESLLNHISKDISSSDAALSANNTINANGTTSNITAANATINAANTTTSNITAANITTSNNTDNNTNTNSSANLAINTAVSGTTLIKPPSEKAIEPFPEINLRTSLPTRSTGEENFIFYFNDALPLQIENQCQKIQNDIKIEREEKAKKEKERQELMDKYLAQQAALELERKRELAKKEKNDKLKKMLSQKSNK